MTAWSSGVMAGGFSDRVSHWSSSSSRWMPQMGTTVGYCCIKAKQAAALFSKPPERPFMAIKPMSACLHSATSSRSWGAAR